MNTSLAAAATAALPMPAFGGAITPSTVPATAKTWAAYMTRLHGSCTPAMLSSALSVELASAQSMLRSLVAQGLLRPAQIVATPAVSPHSPRAVNKLADAVRYLRRSSDTPNDNNTASTYDAPASVPKE